MKNKTLLIQILLFTITLITTTLAGSEWISGKTFLVVETQYSFQDFLSGAWFSIPFLGFLTFHEFGHFLMARYRNIAVTFPYYIPFWLGPFSSIGTMGAFIRIKEHVNKRNDYFDIGIAGPLAGFVIALGVFVYALIALPGIEYLYSLHPNYEAYGADYGLYVYKGLDDAMVLRLGDSLMSAALKKIIIGTGFYPHVNEIVHYPLIMAGYLGLFFTALNLMPIGQLDGGHILYGLIGHKAHNIVSPIFFTVFVFYAGLGTFRPDSFQFLEKGEFSMQIVYFLIYAYFNYLCFSKITPYLKTNISITLGVILLQFLCNVLWPNLYGYQGFMLFGLLIGRYLGIYHPIADETEKLGFVRKVLGWISLLIFVLCFSPNPFY